MDFVTARGLEAGLLYISSIIDRVESSRFFKSSNLCEPFLSGVGLYPSVGAKPLIEVGSKLLLDCLAYANGRRTLGMIAEILDCDESRIEAGFETLLQHKLVERL